MKNESHIFKETSRKQQFKVTKVTNKKLKMWSTENYETDYYDIFVRMM